MEVFFLPPQSLLDLRFLAFNGAGGHTLDNVLLHENVEDNNRDDRQH